MKITHNKVGQNINMVDGVKQEKADGTRSVKDAKNSIGEAALSDTGATKIDLSDRAQEAKRIQELATAAPDVDTEKVEKFRRLIDSGEYKVDAKAVADKMVDEHLETQF